MHEDLAVETCILATRLGLEVLRYFGVPATAEAVTVTAFSPKAFAAHEAGEDIDPADLPVGVGGTGRLDSRSGGGSRWDGHLLLKPTDPPRLVDISADQLHRPERGIRVPGPIVTPVIDVDRWDAGNALTIRSEDGTTLVYARLDNTAWRRAHDWAYRRHGARARGIVAATISEIRAYDAGSGTR